VIIKFLVEETLNGGSPPYISYYMFGGKMVGVRRANQTSGGNCQYRLVGDHLGGTALLVDTTANPGPLVGQRQYYKP